MQRNTVRWTIATVMALVLPFASVAAEKQRSEKQRNDASPGFDDAFAALGGSKVPDGRLMAPFYDYVIWPHAVAAEGKVFCAFQNAQGQSIVMAYRIGEKAWEGPVKVSEFGLKNDDHGNPSICIDRQGHLHAFYGCHGGPMRHARSEKPHDISAWQEQTSPTARATYPQSMRMADGTLCLFYRAGGHMEPWTLRTSGDDGRTWSEPQRVIEMRLAPPDKLAAAYCDFLPGADGRTVHVFWNHKDDNPPRVTKDRPHPWRPLKYPGLHEAVYRYNVYYLKRGPDGVWRNASGEAVTLPVSKAEADAKCLIYDSGDEFAMIGTRIAIDSQDRPYISFGAGVIDWVRHAERSKALVPITDRYAHFADGKWQIAREMPDSWPKDVERILRAPGVLAPGPDWPGGHWYISARRQAIKPGLGCTVFLYNDESGYARRSDGPAVVE